MATYQQQMDPLYNTIGSKMFGCNYGHNSNAVVQAVYLFLKQYTTFQISQTSLNYGKSSANCLCLSGAINTTIGGKTYGIPVNIILPTAFPFTSPKVILSYKLDANSAKTNPLIING